MTCRRGLKYKNEENRLFQNSGHTGAIRSSPNRPVQKRCDVGGKHEYD